MELRSNDYIDDLGLLQNHLIQGQWSFTHGCDPTEMKKITSSLDDWKHMEAQPGLGPLLRIGVNP